jgi:hypothetical protein
LLCLAAVLAACTPPLTPTQVTDRFWRAVVSEHPAKLERYVLPRDHALLNEDTTLLPVASYALGRVLIDGDQATVATTITLAGDTPVTLELDTALVREQETWLVDYRRTADALSAQSDLAQVIGQIGALGQTLRQGVEQSVDEMRKALPMIERELSRIEDKLRQEVPALRERFERFARELEEALETPPPQREPVPEPPAEGTIAL